jgi:hypothetical protein
MISEQEESLFIISPVSRNKKKYEKLEKTFTRKWTKEEEKKFLYYLRQLQNKEITKKELKYCMLPYKSEKQVVSHYHKMKYRYSRLIKQKDSEYLKEMGKFFAKDKKGLGFSMTDEIFGKSMKIENYLLDALIRIQPYKKQKCRNLVISVDGPSLKLATQLAYVNRKLSLLMEDEMKQEINSVSTPCPFEQLCRDADSTLSQEEHFDQDETPQYLISTMARTNYRDALPSDGPYKDDQHIQTKPFESLNYQHINFSEQDSQMSQMSQMDSEFSREYLQTDYISHILPDFSAKF